MFLIKTVSLITTGVILIINWVFFIFIVNIWGVGYMGYILANSQDIVHLWQKTNKNKMSKKETGGGEKKTSKTERRKNKNNKKYVKLRFSLRIFLLKVSWKFLWSPEIFCHMVQYYLLTANLFKSQNANLPYLSVSKFSYTHKHHNWLCQSYISSTWHYLS